VTTTSSIDLYWLPLGAGGHFVAFNGRVYESIMARREHREPLELYHTALVVTVPEGRYVIENVWPIPDANGRERGVVVEGSVGSDKLGSLRALRYEVRCWRDGVIADMPDAVGGPQRVSDDVAIAHRILELVSSVPPLLWGRRPNGCHQMWNSNSVISWLLARSGLPIEEILPPQGGRAPGWSTGIEIAAALEATYGRRDREWTEAKQPASGSPSAPTSAPRSPVIPFGTRRSARALQERTHLR
jgi:hypothetical protein